MYLLTNVLVENKELSMYLDVTLLIFIILSLMTLRSQKQKYSFN